MSSWSNLQNVCSTCRYWTGERDIDFTATIFDAKSPEGKCHNPRSGFNRLDMNEAASCAEWESFSGG